MSFALDLILALEHAIAGQHVPRVRALHLPPAVAIASKSVEFCALELDDGALGISFVLLGGTLSQLVQAKDMDGIIGMDALQLAHEFARPRPGSEDPAADLRRTLGFAAANALSRTVMDRLGFTPPRATGSLGGIDPQAGDHIGMIGLFTPLLPQLLPQLAEAGARLTVVELNPEYLGDHDGYRVTLDATELGACNKVLSTSTILLNHTVDSMLAHCRQASHIALIGPSAGCLPPPLFARGVSLIGGSWVSDRASFIDALRRGESWGQFAYKFALTAADWPDAVDRR